MISLSILAYINSMLSGPCFAGHLRDELSKCLRATKYVEVRIDRVFIDRFHENRTALPAIRQEPAPEVGTLARSSYCSPSTTDEREVQPNDRVRRTKPHLHYVLGP